MRGARKHILITGTGRTGTTFLIQLLTNLGLETGFSRQNVTSFGSPGFDNPSYDHYLTLFESARAGFEYDVRLENAPYIVKTPFFCDYADEVLKRDDIEIEHVFVPMRDLHAAAQSRRYVVENALPKIPMRPSQIPGGLWDTDNANQQEYILLLKIYQLVLALSDATIPLTLMRYPRITKDCSYLYEKLEPILQGIDSSRFRSVFEETVRPDWVHSFNENDC